MKDEVNDFVKTVKKISSAQGVEILDDETIIRLAIDLLKIKAIKDLDKSIKGLQTDK